MRPNRRMNLLRRAHVATVRIIQRYGLPVYLRSTSAEGRMS